MAQAVWTGTEFIVWGKLPGVCSSTTCPGSAGARYNPATDRWAPISNTVPASLTPSRMSVPTVWTGKEMLIWSGACTDVLCAGGGAYDPATDTWREMKTLNAPEAREAYAAVWTGSRMLIWGGQTFDRAHPPPVHRNVGDGGAYDPQTDSWTSITTQGAPSPRIGAHTAWTGTRMLVWGGIFTQAPNFEVHPLADGATYDPATDTWTPMHAGGPAGTGPAVSVWTGTELVVWEGQTAAAYDPQADTWRPLATENAPDPPASGPAVWTGTEVLIWGGPPAYGPGGRYNPATNTWGAMTRAGQPSPRTTPVSVWTGSEMLVWGGAQTAKIILGDGGRFTP
jgi:hypothetical protein